MGKTFNTGYLQNIIQYDGSNNIILPSLIGTGTRIVVTAANGTLSSQTASTTNIAEGTNLYYTDTRVGTYLSANTYATQSYVTTAIANLVDASPATLDTLNELAAALGDDPNFATTVATSIGTKQAQLNGTGFVKVSGTTVSYDNSTYLTTSSASSTYVPYTGASADLVLGANNFSSKRVSVLKSSDGYGGFTSNYLFLQTGSSTTNVGTDGISLFSKPNQRALSINYDIAGVNYAATLDASLLTNSRTFEFPNASGTLALTSNLSAYLPLAGGTLTGALSTSSPIYSSSGTPLTFTNNGNSGTYTQTTIYVNQNNTSADTANGIFIERGKISDAGGAETRQFIIGARGGSIQWRLDGNGSSTQTGNMSAVDVYATGAVRYNGAGLNASDKKLYSPVDGELQWMTHSNAGAHAFSISHQGTRQVYLDVSGNSYFTGGNLGIGLNNPSQKLHVAGNIYCTDTVFGRNLKPEAFAGPVAGSPTGATIPPGYSSMNISSLCDNQWRPLMNNIGDVKAYFWVTLGDAASKDTANYFISMTSPAYGVSNFGNVSYQDNGWNTGGFEFTTDTSAGMYRLLVRCTSYYNSANTAYGTIYFLRLE